MQEDPREIGRTPWQASLDALMTAPGVTGALLVTRDGIPVLVQHHRLRRPETFAAMAAAALTATEVMAREMGSPGSMILRIESARFSMAALAASDELMVVVIAEAGADLDIPIERLREHLPSKGP